MLWYHLLEVLKFWEGGWIITYGFNSKFITNFAFNNLQTNCIQTMLIIINIHHEQKELSTHKIETRICAKWKTLENPYGFIIGRKTTLWTCNFLELQLLTISRKNYLGYLTLYIFCLLFTTLHTHITVYVTPIHVGKCKIYLSEYNFYKFFNVFVSLFFNDFSHTHTF